MTRIDSEQGSFGFSRNEPISFTGPLQGGLLEAQGIFEDGSVFAEEGAGT